MIEKILAHLQERLDEFKDDFNMVLSDQRHQLDPGIERALFGEKEEIMLLVGGDNKYVNMILEHRLNDRNPFDDIQLCKDIIGELEFNSETSDLFKYREGKIDAVLGLYSLLGMEDKVIEAESLYY